jgi:hypothetical protein
VQELPSHYQGMTVADFEDQVVKVIAEKFAA